MPAITNTSPGDDEIRKELAAEPCATCGHGRKQHGEDPRDTSCTECMCSEWRPPRGG